MIEKIRKYKLAAATVNHTFLNVGYAIISNTLLYILAYPFEQVNLIIRINKKFYADFAAGRILL